MATLNFRSTAESPGITTLKNVKNDHHQPRKIILTFQLNSIMSNGQRILGVHALLPVINWFDPVENLPE